MSFDETIQRGLDVMYNLGVKHAQETLQFMLQGDWSTEDILSEMDKLKKTIKPKEQS